MSQLELTHIKITISNSMKQIIFLCALGLLFACQNKKYTPETYAEASTMDDSGSSSKLRNECLSFMNYCDRNYCPDLKLFVRDYLRTYKDWKTEGISDYSDVVSCHLEKKEKGRIAVNVRSIHLTVRHMDDEPPYFKADYNFFSDDAYENLLEMACEEFGEPDDEKETEYGTICRWHVDDVKTISVVPDHWCASFTIKYILE